jgi:hypothetical protein
MCRSGNYQYAVASAQPFPKVPSDIFDEFAFVSFVKLYKMTAGVRLV